MENNPHDSHMSWVNGLTEHAEEPWDPQQSSSVFDDVSTNPMMMHLSSQWQVSGDNHAGFSGYEQSHTYPSENSHQLYNDGGWQVHTENGNNNLGYGVLSQDHQPMQFAQHPVDLGGDLYSLNSMSQQQQRVQHIPSSQAQIAQHEYQNPAGQQTHIDQMDHLSETLPFTQTTHIGDRIQHSEQPMIPQLHANNPTLSSIPYYANDIISPQLPGHGQDPIPAQAPANSPNSYLQLSAQAGSAYSTLGQPGVPMQASYFPGPTQYQSMVTESPAEQPVSTQPLTSPSNLEPSPVAPAPVVNQDPKPTPIVQPPQQLLSVTPISSIPGGAFPLGNAPNLVVGSSTMNVPAYNYKFKVAEARKNASGKSLLGSCPLPCEIERDKGRLYRESGVNFGTNSAEFQNYLAQYRQAMNEIGRSVTDSTRSPSKHKERASTLAPTTAESEESESEDEDEPPPPPLDGPRPGPESPVDRAVWDILKIVWTQEDVPSMEDTRRRFIEFGEYILALSKDFVAAIKNGEKDLSKPSIQALARCVDTTCNYSTPYILKHLGETDKALAALSNSLVTLYNQGNKDNETKKLVASICGLLSEFGTVSQDRYEEIRLSKILPRLAKRFGGDVELLRKKIESKLWKSGGKSDAALPPVSSDVTSSSKSQATPVASSLKPGPANKAAIINQLKPAKRPREDDQPNDAPVAKKPMGDVRGKNALVQLPGPSSKAVRSGLLPGKMPGKQATTLTKVGPPVQPVVAKPVPNLTPATAKSAPAVTKPPSLPSVGSKTLTTPLMPGIRKMNSAIKPESKSELLKAEQKSEQKPSARVLVTDSSSSRLGALLESINSAGSKQTAVNKSVESAETAAQREKRLRREKRGAFRVRWKDDHMLEEVLVFENPNLDHKLARGSANRHRDEGEVLKYASKHRDIEDEETLAILTSEWAACPPLYNLSCLPLGTFVNSPYRHQEVIIPAVDEATGISPLPGTPWFVAPDRREREDGSVELFAIVRDPELGQQTDEQRARKQYENTVLMVAYQSLDDIPATPKSPIPVTTEASVPDGVEQVFTLEDTPATAALIQRFKDVQFQGKSFALANALRSMGKNAPEDPSNSNILDALARLNGFNQGGTAGRPTSGAAASFSQASGLSSDFVADPRAARNRNPRCFTSQQERDTETLRLLKCLQDSVCPDTAIPAPLSKPQDQLHADVRKSDEMITSTIASLGGWTLDSNTPPPHIQNNIARAKEWQEGIYHDEETQRRKADSQRLEVVTNAIKILAENLKASQANQIATAAAAAPAQIMSQAAVQMPAIDQAAAWHAYNTLNEQEYAIWWQQQVQQAQQAQSLLTPQPPPQQQGAVQQMVAANQGGQPLQPLEQQQAVLLQQLPGLQAAAPDLLTSLQAMQNDPSFGQYLQMAYALQAQQSQGAVAQPGPSNGIVASDPGLGGSGNVDPSLRDVDGVNAIEAQSQNRKKVGKAAKPALVGTKPCAFYRKGKCTKGASCTYRHD